MQREKDITFINKAGAIFDEDLLMKAMLWKSTSNILNTKTVYLYGKYPAIGLGRYKYHIHRLIMSYVRKSALRRNQYVNHINENKLDSRIENLEVLEASHHQSITNKGRKQSKEWMEKRINNVTKTRYGHYVYEGLEIDL